MKDNATGATSDVALAYNEWARQYDTNANPTRDLDAVVLRNAGLKVAGSDVLELGCGTGKNSVWIAQHAKSLIAMDFSSGMLDVARNRVRSSNITFVQQDIQLPWAVESNSVDVVVGDLVLEHVENLAPVFAEAFRVLRTDGELFFCELHPIRQWQGGQARFTDPDTQSLKLVTAFQHSASEFVNTAIAAGFVVRSLGEWRENEPSESFGPRLLSMIFSRP